MSILFDSSITQLFLNLIGLKKTQIKKPNISYNKYIINKLPVIYSNPKYDYVNKKLIFNSFDIELKNALLNGFNYNQINNIQYINKFFFNPMNI